MDHEESQSIIRRVVAGQDDQFRLLVREHQLMVRSYIATQLHRIDEADDLAQEVFISAFQSLDTFVEGADFAAWLRGIARNHLRVHFRTTARRNRRHSLHREQLIHEMQYDLESRFTEQKSEAIETLLHCISRLPDRLRKVVRAGLDGIKAPALADEMNTSVGAIYNLHYRANGCLRDCMQKLVEE